MPVRGYWVRIDRPAWSAIVPVVQPDSRNVSIRTSVFETPEELFVDSRFGALVVG